MRPHIVWTIFRKEITEALRDRLTLIVVLGLPILIYPLVITSLARIQRTHEAAEDRRISRVMVWGQPVPPLVDFLSGTNFLALAMEPEIPAALQDPAAANALKNADDDSDFEADAKAQAKKEELHRRLRAEFAQKKVDAALVLWPGTQNSLDRLDSASVTIFYDSIRPGSEKAAERLRRELTRFRQHLVEIRQDKLNLPKGFSRPLEIRSTSVASARNEFGDRFGRLLPLLLIMLSATGALYAAVDLTAGEKDRATMQTLLCAPVLPLEIVAGKFLTVWSVSLVSALANITSLAFTFTRVAASIQMPSIPFWALLGVLGLLALVTCTVAATFVGVAALARDAKDAGNFLSATLIMLTLPVAASVLPGVELNSWTAFVPLVNLSLLIKAVFLEGMSANIIFLTVVASFGYALLALVFAARVFGREEILLGGSVSWRQLVTGERKAAPQPTPGLAIGVFVIVLVATFYGSLLVENRSLKISVPVVQYGFFLLPVVALAVWNRFSVKETFSLRKPHWRSVVGAVLIGISGATAVAGITMRLLPPPPQMVDELKQVLMVGEGQSLVLLLLLLAVTPAVCEETLFRGMIMAGLRRLGPWPAIGISALLFGLAHTNIYRLLPTFILGLALGYVAWRSGSIYCSMIVHALNNGFVLILVNKGEDWFKVSMVDIENVPWSFTVIAAAVMALGLWLIKPRQARIPAA